MSTFAPMSRMAHHLALTPAEQARFIAEGCIGFPKDNTAPKPTPKPNQDWRKGGGEKGRIVAALRGLKRGESTPITIQNDITPEVVYGAANELGIRISRRKLADQVYTITRLA